MASTTSENRKRNEKKSTEQEEAHFVSRVTVILTREKERDYLLNLHMSQSTCFGTWIETGVDFYGWQSVPRASTVQKGEHVKDNRAKRSNVEVTSIVGGRLLSCVRRVLSYTWHRERHVELLVMYDQTFGTRTLLAHAQRRRKEKKIKAQRKKEEKIKIREKKCDPTVQISVSMNEISANESTDADTRKQNTQWASNNHKHASHLRLHKPRLTTSGIHRHSTSPRQRD